MHQQMAVEGLLETAPALPALTKVPDEEEAVEPEVIPGTPLSDIILDDRR